MTTLLGILIASLAGSVHCAGMCGPFVCVYAGLNGGPGRGAAHAAYHAGRLVSYAVLGAIAGSLGLAANRLGLLVGVSRGAAFVAGTLMIVWGVSAILTARGVVLPWRRNARHVRSPFAALLSRVRGRSPAVRAGATGLLTTLLPCGWLYAFVAAAAGSGSALGGVVTMSVFWLGTLPALTVLGIVAQRVAGRYGSRLPIAAASFVVLLGLLTIAGRMGWVPALGPGMGDPGAHRH